MLAIGKVTVAWGALESAIDLSIGRLLGLGTFDPRGSIITAHMTWPLKMDVLESLAAALSKDFPRLTELGAVKPLLKKAQEARNLVVHGHWVQQDDKVYRLRTTARGKLRADLSSIPLTAIETAVATIGAAGRAVLQVIFDA